MGNAMATRALLDETRTEIVENPFTRHVYARDINNPASKNLVHRWIYSGVITLMPVNLLADFQENNIWESLKFRLTDCSYNTDYWTETPVNTRGDKGPADWFFNGIVKSFNVPTGYPSSCHFMLL
jgi:hypothetical protein